MLSVMPDRPSTPPTTKPPSLTIHNTPHSQGSSSHYTYHSQHFQDHYKPYLKEDLKHKCSISFDEFLNDILHLPADWIEQSESQISNIVKEKSFLDKISAYCQPVEHETHRYPPFIVLANYVLEKLDQNSESSLSFCRNDPIYVKGSSGQRKPDVVGVRWECLKVLNRLSVDNLMKGGPEEMAFCWTELLSFWEFKLERRDLLKPVHQDKRTRDHSFSKFDACCSDPSVIFMLCVSGGPISISISTKNSIFRTQTL
jgi:hypothetical protein